MPVGQPVFGDSVRQTGGQAVTCISKNEKTDTIAVKFCRHKRIMNNLFWKLGGKNVLNFVPNCGLVVCLCV